MPPFPREQRLNRRLPTQLHLRSVQELVSTEAPPAFEGTPDEVWNHHLNDFFPPKLADMVCGLTIDEIRLRLDNFASIFDTDKKVDAQTHLAALGLEVPQPPARPPTLGRGGTAGVGDEGDGGGEAARPRGRGATANVVKKRRVDNN